MTEDEFEYRKAEAKRAAFDEKHPRCDACGQFLKKRPPRPEGSLIIDLYPQSEWISHYTQDYWGEWDHV